MDALAAYGSDGEEAEDAGSSDVKTAVPIPEPKKGRRTITLPVPLSRSSNASKIDDDDDDDDRTMKTSRNIGASLLDCLPAPKMSGSQSMLGETRKSNSASQRPRSVASTIFEQLCNKSKTKLPLPSANSTDSGAGEIVGPSPGGGVSEPYESQQSAEETAAAEVPAGPMVNLPPGWGAAWDETSQSYYYYHAESGETRWEPPEMGGNSGESLGAISEELRRELMMQQRRRGGGAEGAMPTALIKEVTAEQLKEGEKHMEYRSAASSWQASAPLMASAPGRLAKRKHQITDVLHHASQHELEYLDKASESRKSKMAVSARYGW